MDVFCITPGRNGTVIPVPANNTANILRMNGIETVSCKENLCTACSNAAEGCGAATEAAIPATAYH